MKGDLTMTKTEKKKKAQDLIMHHLSSIGYGLAYEDYIKAVGEDGEQIVLEQMNRIAKIMGFKHAWYS